MIHGHSGGDRFKPALLNGRQPVPVMITVEKISASTN